MKLEQRAEDTETKENMNTASRTSLKENEKRHAELLAPAGSLDICKAVINAGADAVYLGGKRFGARAFAGNLSDIELLDAIDYAHLKNSKIYLTLNTLIKESEIWDAILYLKPLYEAGLDAVIVQDLGLLTLIHKYMPELPIHLSTQMSIMTDVTAEIFKKWGATRVVLPREFSINDISDFTKGTDMEVEVFVHGALCYSYSGRCLFSSARGERSGNRGTCAQPCRLKWRIDSFRGISDKDMHRLLSPRDIAAIDILPEILDGGAYSLKLEGRMKNINYAAGVTSVYRKYLDMYLEGMDVSDYKVESEDMTKLLDLFNRGSFSRGFFMGKKNSGLLAGDRSGHNGTAAVRVLSEKNGRVNLLCLSDIGRGDVICADEKTKASFTCGESVKKGDTFIMNLPKKYALKKGMILYRTNNASLQNSIIQRFVKREKTIAADILFIAKKGEETFIKVSQPDTNISAEVRGEIALEARTRAVKADDIKQQLEKLGNTPFHAGKIKVIADDNIFISVGGIKSLRRGAIDELTHKIKDIHRRNSVIFDNNKKSDIISENFAKIQAEVPLHIYVQTKEQLEVAMQKDLVRRIYISPHFPEIDKGLIEKIKDSGKEVFFALPMIVGMKHKEKFNSILKALDEFCFDGVLVRNIDSLVLISEGRRKGLCNDLKSCVTDYTVYLFNRHSRLFIRDLASLCGFDNICGTYPSELSSSELEDIFLGEELVIYGRTVLMQTEHCLKKNVLECDGVSGFFGLTDERGKTYMTFSDCDFCNNLIYDASPLCLSDIYARFIKKGSEGRAADDFLKIRPASVRVELTTESGDFTGKLLSSIETGDEVFFLKKTGITSHTGHFYKSIL